MSISKHAILLILILRNFSERGKVKNSTIGKYKVMPLLKKNLMQS